MLGPRPPDHPELEINVPRPVDAEPLDPGPPPGARGGLPAVLLAASMVAVLGVVLVTRPDPGPARTVSAPSAAEQLIPDPGRTGAATCTDPADRREWRVTWRATTSPTPEPTGSAPADRAGSVTLVPTGFAVRPLAGAAGSAGPAGVAGPTPTPGPALAGGWQSQDDGRWLLRWSPTLAEVATAVPNEEWVRMGPLATLAAVPMTVHQDPRFVTPDGACSVYLAPFISGTAGTDTVAVVGDSLLGQLSASEDGTATGAGWLLRRLTAAGDRVEIAGQGGRRWTITPDVAPGLEQAEASMQDELRGLRDARAVVVALGTNDAGWVARAPDQEQYALRLAWTLLHLGPMLDELRDHGHCTVLLTMAQRNKSYVDTAPGRFDAVATRINDYLRRRANADPDDGLKLADWAALADSHGTGDPQPWFGPDTIHLNLAGQAPYADALTRAAALC